MVWTPAPGMLKSIVSGPKLSLASRIACVSDPGPSAKLLSTVKVLGSVRSSRQVSLGMNDRRRRPERDLVFGRRVGELDHIVNVSLAEMQGRWQAGCIWAVCDRMTWVIAQARRPFARAVPGR